MHNMLQLLVKTPEFGAADGGIDMGFGDDDEFCVVEYARSSLTVCFLS
jgi:hypothetical protein